VPGWTGVVLRRPSPVCARALDRLLLPEDLSLVTAAYLRSQDAENRALLVTFIEGLSLEMLVRRSRGGDRGFSPEDHSAVDGRMRAWLADQCGYDDTGLLAARLSAEVRRRVDHPMGPDACRAWQLVLLRGEPVWWPAAARQLYRCGGPPVFLSMLRTDRQENKDERSFLLGWYRLGQDLGPR
jgi:hypothetical protein